MSIDQNTGEPYVSVEFDSGGRQAFGESTEENVGRRLAIVLDGNVHSAPRDPRAHPLRARPDHGRLHVRGGDATSRSCCAPGRCPAPVQVLEERTVGPSLGADSIRKGVVSTARRAPSPSSSSC